MIHGTVMMQLMMFKFTLLVSRSVMRTVDDSIRCGVHARFALLNVKIRVLRMLIEEGMV